MDRSPKRERIFLLSPARFGGPRTTILLREAAELELSVRLRSGTATLGEVHAFISSLYFRGKIAYTKAFAAPPPGMASALIITPGHGLLPAETKVDAVRLKEIGSVPVDETHAGFREPFLRAAQDLVWRTGPQCDFILLGSIASQKYTGPLLSVMGERLLFPADFVGRGDMSRGGLMLRCAASGVELEYIGISSAVLRGRRPAKLEPLKRTNT